jgi:uncharacterized protein (TIGR02996 family)
MDEASYLRTLTEDRDNIDVRLAYWNWLEETKDNRAPFVRLMRERLRLQEELQKTERLIWDYELRLDIEWIDFAFPIRVCSPTAGRCYTKPTPEAAPFVSPGSRVSPDTVVCLIEIMGLYSEIRADVHGVVSEIEVADGDVVEYNQVLVRLNRPSSDFW